MFRVNVLGIIKSLVTVFVVWLRKKTTYITFFCICAWMVINCMTCNATLFGCSIINHHIERVNYGGLYRTWWKLNSAGRNINPPGQIVYSARVDYSIFHRGGLRHTPPGRITIQPGQINNFPGGISNPPGRIIYSARADYALIRLRKLTFPAGWNSHPPDWKQTNSSGSCRNPSAQIRKSAS